MPFITNKYIQPEASTLAHVIPYYPHNTLSLTDTLTIFYKMVILIPLICILDTV